MNYYERYSGDYLRDTQHLSLAEHGAYTLLMDTYYATETPLPAAMNAIYRICRAMSKPEQEAVRSVCDQFFPVGEDGLRRHGRIDAEIEKALKRIGAARENGRSGGRPKKPNKNPVGFQNKTQWVTDGLAKQNPVETHAGEASPHATRHAPSKSKDQQPCSTGVERFAEFWLAYPRKASKPAALKAFMKLAPDDATVTAMLSALARHKRSEQWAKDGGKFIPHPATWINGRRWEDETEVSVAAEQPGYMAGAL